MDDLVRKYGPYDGPFWVNDPMVSAYYKKYDPNYNYPPDLAAELFFEDLREREHFEEKEAEQEAAKKTPPSTHSGE
jgi:hypothetical protein